MKWIRGLFLSMFKALCHQSLIKHFIWLDIFKIKKTLFMTEMVAWLFRSHCTNIKCLWKEGFYEWQIQCENTLAWDISISLRALLRDLVDLEQDLSDQRDWHISCECFFHIGSVIETLFPKILKNLYFKQVSPFRLDFATRSAFICQNNF